MREDAACLWASWTPRLSALGSKPPDQSHVFWLKGLLFGNSFLAENYAYPAAASLTEPEPEAKKDKNAQKHRKGPLGDNGGRKRRGPPSAESGWYTHMTE